MAKPFICRGCGEKFSSMANFDKHRTGSYKNEHPNYGRRCLSHGEMKEIGLEMRPTGIWHDPVITARAGAIKRPSDPIETPWGALPELKGTRDAPGA